MASDTNGRARQPVTRGQSLDVLIGFLVPYIAAGGTLVLTMDEFEISQAIWAFVLPVLLLFFPLFAIPYNPVGIAVIAMIAGAFYVIPRLLSPGYSRYAFALLFVAWGVYGIRCTEWIAA